MVRVQLAAFALAAALLAACAADPGDSPRGDGSPGLSMGLEGAVGDGALASPDGGYAGDDATADMAAPEDTSVPMNDGTATNDTGMQDTGSFQMDAPPDVPSCTSCAIELKYKCPTTAAMTQDIRPYYDIYNNGTSSQSLTELTVRYYFTADGSQSQAFVCDYALIGNTLVQGTFVTMATPKATADHYLEISFTGGSIAAGSHTGEIQNRFHDSAYQGMFTQTNDYSFDATKTAYADWNNVTVYRNGTLVWGVEP